MNGRERLERAFSAGGTTEVTVVLSCYPDIYSRDHWDELTGCPWWYAVSPVLDHQLQWRLEAEARTGEDWFRLPFCDARAKRESARVEIRGDRVFLVDDRTGRAEEQHREPVGGWPDTSFAHPDALAQTEEEIDRLVPLPSGDPDDVEREGRNDLARLLRAERAPHGLGNHRTETPFFSCTRLWGFEGTMMMTAGRRDLVRHACERYLARATRRVAEAARLGAEVIWIVDGITDMISPLDFAELNVPSVSHLVQAVRAAGMKSVYYFTGNLAGKLDLILSAGADALAVEESKKGFVNDIVQIADHVRGRCTLFGNVDPYHVLEMGTADQVRAELRHQREAGQRNGNRFVTCLGSPITPGTTVAQVRQFCEIARE
jgi:hypothetical protein